MSRVKAQLVVDVRPQVDALVAQALARRASDLHVEPMAEGYEARVRIDGVLERIEGFTEEVGASIVARLMVMGQLLTYRRDVPQEGRIEWAGAGGKALTLRLSVMPTTHGLRAAVRLPADLLQPRKLEGLGLPEHVLEGLKAFAAGDAGMLLLTGAAGSGKTTTIYALLEYIAATSAGLSMIALEDPVERDLPGVTQIQVSPFGELTYERALKSILRQDPQVLMLGEIRDAATASLAIQAALSGHRLISTLHAGTPAGAVARLLEMGVEPYQITAALWGVVAQRLLRKREGEVYQGRVPVAELGRMDATVRQVILRSGDTAELAGAFEKQTGYAGMRQVADRLIQEHVTDGGEVQRVFGNER